MIRFLLNDKEISTSLPTGMLLLDFIRYHQQLKGTKIGCREGDCGACMVLVGNMQEGSMQYRALTSCLTPLRNVNRKHVVTIEGLAMPSLSPVQQAMCDCSATQCGFCTPGFVVSLTGYCLSRQESSAGKAIASIDGNICRCTGYKSIERAAMQVHQLMQHRNGEDPVAYAAGNHLLPSWFSTICERLLRLPASGPEDERGPIATERFVGGGTDLYVQQPALLSHTHIRILNKQTARQSITLKSKHCFIGPSATVTDLCESPVLQAAFPALHKYMRLVSSTPIRNMATIAGNIVNASPIGDLTIFFLALDASVVLSDGTTRRELPLRQLYKGYKTLDKKPNEWIDKIVFTLPCQDTLFNFEKVSKRTHLDIASVNTAMRITMQDDTISQVHLSAGGVGPVPAYLQQTILFLQGKRLIEELVLGAVAIAQAEVTPISDVRGAAEYKRLLLSQLIKAHFITLFPRLRVELLLNV